MAMTLPIQEDHALPPKKSPGYSWLSVQMPDAVTDVLRDVAQDDGRSMSNMARRLIEEGLRARGRTWPETPPPPRGRPPRGSDGEDADEG